MKQQQLDESKLQMKKNTREEVYQILRNYCPHVVEEGGASLAFNENTGN